MGNYWTMYVANCLFYDTTVFFYDVDFFFTIFTEIISS